MRARLTAALAALVACDDGGGVVNINPADVFTPAAVEFGVRRVGGVYEATTQMIMPVVLTVVEVRFETQSVFAARVKGGGTLNGTILRPGTPVDVLIRFEPLADAIYDAAMVVVFNDGRTVSLPITARGREGTGTEFAVSPEQVTFPATEVGADVVLPISLNNDGEDLVAIREIRGRDGRALGTSDDFWVTRVGGGSVTPLNVPPMERIALELHFKPDAVGAFDEDVQFVLEGSDAAAAELTASGSGLPAGDLSCAPNRMDFGAVVRGRAAERSATCTVVGGVYTVTRAVLEASASPLFRLTAGPAAGTSLMEGQSFELRAVFAAEGEPIGHSGTIGVVSGRGDTRVISLVATVVPPPLNETALSVALTWPVDDIDLDLHLVRNAMTPFDPLNDCYFQRKVQRWGNMGTTTDDPVLDQDSAGLGPEIVNLQSFGDARYDVYVHYYRRIDAPIAATVDVRFNGNSAGRATRMLPTCGAMWHMGTVLVNGGIPQFVPVDAMSDAKPRGMCQ